MFIKDTSSNKSDIGLVRQLSLFDSIMIMAGIIIGSGIFVTTGIMIKTVPSIPLVLLIWVVGGLLTLAGALTYAELGASMPEAGGQYVYLRKAFGPLVGFLFGWVLFLVYMTGGIAGLAVAFAEYLGHFFPSLSTKYIVFATQFQVFNHTFQYSISSGQLVAIFVILLLSFFNYLGVGLGKTLQNILTVLKIGILFFIVVLGFTIGEGQAIDFSFNPMGLSFGKLVMGLGMGLVMVAWAYDGWNNVTFVAGEIKNPKRNLPMALFLGTVGVTVLYILVNVVYFYALPLEVASGEIRIAEKAAGALFGSTASTIISAAVVVSIFGSINGSILAGPRVYYAMARDGLFFKKVATVNSKFRTPGFSILVQAIWASVYALSGTFEQILTSVVFVSVMFWIAAAISVFVLRKKYPHMERPYKTWGYPIVPIIFIVASSGILINALFEQPMASLAGIIFTLTGIPVYFTWKRKRKS
jgi:APA family basic amino acid/polyamine antiporter